MDTRPRPARVRGRAWKPRSPSPAARSVRDGPVIAGAGTADVRSPGWSDASSLADHPQSECDVRQRQREAQQRARPRRHTARGDQDVPARPRVPTQRELRPGGRHHGAAPGSRAPHPRAGRHRAGRRPRSRPPGPEPQRSRLHGRRRDRPLLPRALQGDGCCGGDPRTDLGERLPVRGARPRRHLLGLRSRTSGLQPAHPGRARRGRSSHRNDADAVSGGAEPPAHLPDRGVPPRADVDQPTEPRARRDTRRANLRHRQHRHRRAALRIEARAPLPGSGGGGRRRLRQPLRRRHRSSPRELERRPRPDRRSSRTARGCASATPASSCRSTRIRSCASSSASRSQLTTTSC